MEEKDKSERASTNVRSQELDKKYFNLMRVVICMKLERRTTLLMGAYHPAYCHKCGTHHEELITFIFNYN